MAKFAIIQVLCVVFTCICQTLSQVTPEHAIVNGTNGDAAIKCIVADGTGLQGHFEFHGSRVADDGNRKKTTFVSGVLTLDIKSVDYVTEIGEYKCIFNQGETFMYDSLVYLNALPHVNKFDKSKNLVEGDKLVLHCDAYGYPTVVATWFNGDVMLEEDSRISFSDYKLGSEDKDPSVSNGTLTIKNVVFSDAGDYSCNATNDFGANSRSITIRVKSKYAALWPFLGICAEVIILCVIIFIYERRRAAKLAKEDAKEEENDKLNANSGDVRQRKT